MELPAEDQLRLPSQSRAGPHRTELRVEQSPADRALSRSRSINSTFPTRTRTSVPPQRQYSIDSECLSPIHGILQASERRQGSASEEELCATHQIYRGSKLPRRQQFQAHFKYRWLPWYLAPTRYKSPAAALPFSHLLTSSSPAQPNHLLPHQLPHQSTNPRSQSPSPPPNLSISTSISISL